MATANLILDLENNLDLDNILSAISHLKGVKEVTVRPKTKTEELLERMEAGEDIDDNEYFDSIPGMWERIEASSNEPPENWTPMEEIRADRKKEAKNV